jgi:site-specific recombinase XerD
MGSLREKMLKDLTIRGFASSTKESYLRTVKELAAYYMTPPDKVSEEQLLEYIYYLTTNRQLSCGSINVALAALRFFYRETVGQNNMALLIPPRKHPRKLPEILNHEELKALFASVNNRKHRAILMTAYGGGLRSSEVTHLKIKHIDSERMLIRIENGKGGKDRYTILSKRLLVELRAYWKKYRPKDLLFPSPVKDAPLNRASLGLVFKTARERAGITKNVTFHSLRHAFATNLLESGVNIRTIQILLGHSSINSTTLYLHVARKDIDAVTSPLDLIDIANIDRFKQLKP